LYWLVNVDDYLRGATDVSVEGIPTHDQCKLGIWLGMIQKDAKSTIPGISDLEKNHQTYHKVLHKSVELRHGDKQASADFYGQLKANTQKMLDQLKTVEKYVHENLKSTKVKELH
ncbi:MAG: CZB domain-containing protein, partial [Spirochaetota bacterium]